MLAPKTDRSCSRWVGMQSPQLVGASQTDCAEHRARSADRKIKRSMVWAANAQAVAAQGVVVSEEGVRRKKKRGAHSAKRRGERKSENAKQSDEDARKRTVAGAAKHRRVGHVPASATFRQLGGCFCSFTNLVL